MSPEGHICLGGHEVRRLHCVGVGGMGLGPLAIYLAGLGVTVSGEDDAPTEAMLQQLSRAGVALGPLPESCDLVVCSSAIKPAHPAQLAARDRRIPVMRRGELLAELARDRKLVAVCGSHGKTTTTAMLITALRTAGFPCGYVLGGLFGDEQVPPAQVGQNEWLVAEIDESDGTIGRFAPEITLAVNMDWDHPDFYRTQADLEQTFAALFARTRGSVLVWKACAWSTRVAPAGALTFGAERADFSSRISQETGRCLELHLGGRFAMQEAAVQAQGEFNATNATAALAAAQLMGAPLTPALLAQYPGVRRRQGVLLATPELTVLEDYAHHPAEIHALLASLRRRVQAGEARRLVVAFQPHRYSRTAQFKNEFARVLIQADVVILLDAYGAGEKPIIGGRTEDLWGETVRVAGDRPVFFQSGEEAFLQTLIREVRAGDLVAVVGAGDIDRVARRWLDRRRWATLAEALAPQLASAAQLTLEEPLAPRTTMRAGGAARLLAEPTSVADLGALLRTAQAQGVPVLPLGRGSNILVPDEGVEALVVSLQHPAWARFERRADGRVWAGAGLRLKNLCGLAAKAGLQGFEFLEGIPGSLGGALRMNAGAMGHWIFEVVDSVQYMTAKGALMERRAAELTVEYRQCRELAAAVVVSAVLRPAGRGETVAIKRQIEILRGQRHAAQPREPSAGCIFKNPPGDSAGRLIEQCGLKGLRIGDAEVSPVHANFIVNRGAARTAEIVLLVQQVRARVRAATGVELTPEVLLLGRDWKDFL